MHYCFFWFFLLYTQKQISIFAALYSEDTIISSQRLTLKKPILDHWKTKQEHLDFVSFNEFTSLQEFAIFSIIKWKIRFLYTALPWIRAMAVTTIEISHKNQTNFLLG